MNKLLSIIGFLCVLCSFTASAQFAYFPTKGTIYFDKVDHPKARIRQIMNNLPNGRGAGFFGNIEQMEETVTSQYVLTFDQNQSLMKPVDASTSTSQTRTSSPIGGGGNMGGGRQGGGQGRQGQGGGMNRPPNRGMQGGLDLKNSYYQNFKNGESKVQIELDEFYVLEDTLQGITWRFTDEYREIAGYECRRVNGATQDSLYLVAFYTDQIPLSSGPVMVNGLPGMILGLAIPEKHVNYWATKVEFTTDDVERSWQNKKAKTVKTNDFADILLKQIGRNPWQPQTKNKLIEQIYF